MRENDFNKTVTYETFNFTEASNKDCDFSPLLNNAWNLFKEERYLECISLLKYKYDNLPKDANANSLLGLCYSKTNNYYEAIKYTNFAITLDKRNSIFYYNKGYYLFKNDLPIDALKCLNYGYFLSKNDDEQRKFETSIYEIIDSKIQNFKSSIINNDTQFKEYIYYIDSILNLRRLYPNFKNEFMNLKRDIISAYFNKIKIYLTINKNIINDYPNYINSLKILHESADDFEIKNTIYQEIIKYTEILEKEITNKDLKNYIHDLQTYGYHKDEICEATIHRFPSIDETIIHNILFINPTTRNKKKINRSPNRASVNPILIENLKEDGLSKPEIIEQVSLDYGVSSETALKIVNAIENNDDDPFLIF